MQLPTLYKRGKQAGAMLQWKVWTEGAMLHTEHGQVGGKLQTTVGNEKQGKNIGQKNQTTPVEQAQKEAEAAWQKRRDRGGYRESMAEARDYLHSVPMLAHKYEEHVDKIKFPVLVQPKLDGLRCLAYRDKSGKVVLQGRKITFYTAPKHIIAELDDLLDDDTILDGELYDHGLDLQDINSLAKRYQSGLTERLNLHCYDITKWSEQGQAQEDRVHSLEVWFETRGVVRQVVQVPTFTCAEPTRVKHLHDCFAKDGYEGAMVRTLDHEYEFDTRSRGLLKMKEFMEEEFEIIAVAPGRGKAAVWPVFTCANPKGTQKQEFDVMPKGSDEQRRKMLKDAPFLIGKLLTVRFHQWTPYGHPEQPRGIVIREDA
jgi:DNA ligase-1